jgi:hypothetical protein
MKGDDFGPAGKMGQCLGHEVLTHGADVAERLTQDDIGVEAAEQLRVDGDEGRPMLRCPDAGVDLTGRQ